ncbi:MAG: hypothetical protein M1816_000349 [Peltula sp. TS41687]|nr:MAG: hypothetical protein M1816_000349 [Peltula sp. TS41687]
MRSTLVSLAFAAFAAASPRPQSLDIKAVQAAPDPTILGPPVGAVQQTIVYNAEAAAASATEVAALPTRVARRWVTVVQKRDVNDACAPQPSGYGPKANPDTAEAFLSDPVLQASDAAEPQGYTVSFRSKKGSVSGNTYMGYKTLESYNTVECAQFCDATYGCAGFNIYYERDPSFNPAQACPNPASTTNIKCSLWGSPVTPESATNEGQWRGPMDQNGEAFHVVIAGSAGFNRNAPPPSCTDFTGPVRLGGAINAPLDNGVDTYIGMKYTNAPYDPNVCAEACKAQTDYNRLTANNGVYKPCNFFTAYVISKSNIPEGMYCAMYTRAWGPEYATNQGQWRGADYYSVSNAYSFTLNVQDSGTVHV